MANALQIIQGLGLDAEEPYPGFIVVPDFAAKVLDFNADTLLEHFQKYIPWRGQNDEIEPFALQGVLGTNVNLRYRGNELKRNKIWAQKGPVSKGVRVYSYTGFAYPVALATSNWEDSESLNAMSERMNAFISKIGGPEMNHLIMTAYNNGSCNIGWHYDKTRSLHPDTWIAVVKLGPSSRRFALRRRAGEGENQDEMPVVFDRIVPKGALILMSMEANLATQHAVPVSEDEDMGLSGSIVWRNVTNVLKVSELEKRAAKTVKGREERQAKKRSAHKAELD